jgi:hypothetical protein
MAQRPRRKRRRSGATARPRRGVMIGMRSGFQKAANKVVGSESRSGRKSSWLSTAFTILLVIAAVAFLLYRWQ